MKALAGRLYASVLLLEDAAGKRVAFIAADLHSGSRYVTEQVAIRTAPLGVGLPELYLCGTHTHASAGNFFGSPYYDTYVSAAAGFDETWVGWLVDQLVSLVETAHARMSPARVGFGTETLKGWSRNRSYSAYLNNFPPQGATPAPGAEKEAVDPVLRCMWAESLSGDPLGAFGTFGAHGTLMASELATGSSDYFGESVRVATRDLGLPANVFLGLSAGVVGDVDPAHVSLSQEQVMQQRGTADGALRLIAQMGRAVGATYAAACRAARSNLVDVAPIITRYAEPVAVGATLHDGRRLATKPAIGMSTLAGSEMGRGFGWEGWRSPFADDGDAQWPKPVVALAPIESALGKHPRTVPLRLVSVGNWLIAGLPGEPTVTLADSLRTQLGEPELVVCAVTGDYGGYLTTPREYETQQYEGASTIWGRWCGDWLLERYGALLAHGSPPLDPSIGFLVSPAKPFRLEAPAHQGSGVPEWPMPPHASFDASSRRAWGSWFGWAPSMNHEVGRGPWVAVVDAVTQLPLTDDTQVTVLLAFDVQFNTIEWRWSFVVPGALTGRRVCVVPVGPPGVAVKPPQGSHWPVLSV